MPYGPSIIQPLVVNARPYSLPSAKRGWNLVWTERFEGSDHLPQVAALLDQGLFKKRCIAMILLKRYENRVV